jgi:predicted Zn-dependent protease
MFLEVNKMKKYFYELADHIQGAIKKDEVFMARINGEESDFVRINNCKIRQGGSVSQYYLDILLINGKRQASNSFVLSKDKDNDILIINKNLESLRTRLNFLPEDPYLLYSTENNSSEQIGENILPDSREVISEILNSFEGSDLVGIYASGGIMYGFASSFGQRNWFEKYNFNLDWSVYHKSDKAVKARYAGFNWDSKIFKSKKDKVIKELNAMTKDPKTISPGKYRVYLAPSALEEFIGMLSWGGFSLKAQKTKNTPLLKMIDDNVKLHTSVTMKENTINGLSPNFQKEGFIKDNEIVLIENGKYSDSLVSPRSAKEYGVETNGSGANESPESFEMLPGDIEEDKILETLGTGVYMNNAWYLNYSDRSSARITGMSRFASFWVEGGKIKEPLNVMRFDESMYRMLGENLVGLTKNQEFLASADTYYSRSTSSIRLPGAIVKDFTFTL